MNDALVLVSQGVNSNAKLSSVISKRLDLSPRGWFCDGQVDVQSWGVVIFGGNG